MDNQGREVLFSKIADGGKYLIHLESIDSQVVFSQPEVGEFYLSENGDCASNIKLRLYDLGNGNFSTAPETEEWDDHFRVDGMKYLKVEKKLVIIIKENN